MLACTIYYRAVDGALFAYFLKEQVLPRCNPFPGPRLVLVINNYSIHLVAKIRELCDKAGIVIKYLPLYSPDFNLIKELFSVAKAWIKRYYKLAHTMSFREFLYTTIDAYSRP